MSLEAAFMLKEHEKCRHSGVVLLLLLLKTTTSKHSYPGITFRVATVIVSTEESHEHCKGLTYQQQHKAQKKQRLEKQHTPLTLSLFFS